MEELSKFVGAMQQIIDVKVLRLRVSKSSTSWRILWQSSQSSGGEELVTLVTCDAALIRLRVAQAYLFFPTTP